MSPKCGVENLVVSKTLGVSMSYYSVYQIFVGYLASAAYSLQGMWYSIFPAHYDHDYLFLSKYWSYPLLIDAVFPYSVLSMILIYHHWFYGIVFISNYVCHYMGVEDS